jgi:hypothetical protein
MFKQSAAILFAISIAPVLPAFAQDVPATSAQKPMSVYDEMALAVLPDSMIDPQIDNILNALLSAMLQREPNFKDMEITYPGLNDNLKSTLKLVFKRIVHEVIPLQRADLSKFYATNLTQAEARQAISFLKSSEMKKFKNNINQNGIDFKNSVSEVIDKEVASTNSVTQDLQSAGERAGATMTNNEMKFLSNFMASALGIKLKKLTPQKIAIDTKWMNYSTPEYDKAIAEATIEGIAGHIEKKDKDLGKLLREEMRKGLSKELSGK